MITLAELISLLLHPVIFFLSMPFIIVYKQTASSMYALKWEIFSALFIGVGILFVLYDVRKGIFSDYDLSKREERHRFYLILGILASAYLLISFLFKGMFFPLSIITLGIILGIAIFEIVDYYIKASVHIAVSAAWVITMGVLYGQEVFIATAWIVPLLVWSRLALRKHTVTEIVSGAFLGAVIPFVTLIIARHIYA